MCEICFQFSVSQSPVVSDLYVFSTKPTHVTMLKRYYQKFVKHCWERQTLTNDKCFQRKLNRFERYQLAWKSDADRFSSVCANKTTHRLVFYHRFTSVWPGSGHLSIKCWSGRIQRCWAWFTQKPSGLETDSVAMPSGTLVWSSEWPSA